MLEPSKPSRQFATTLAHGIELLNCFGMGEAVLSNKDFVTRTGLSKATVSRLTYTLSLIGFLRYDSGLRKYRLGSAVVSVGYPLLQGLEIRQLARPLMKTLADHARGSVSLGMRDRTRMVYVETSRGHEALAFRPDTGASLPLLGSAIGHAWLCRAEPELRARALEQIRVQHPDQWAKYHDGFPKVLQDFERRGFTLSLGDFQRDIHSVAVPMRRAIDGVVMVFNCGVPKLQLGDGTLVNDIGPRLVAMVDLLEQRLSRAAPPHPRQHGVPPRT